MWKQKQKHWLGLVILLVVCGSFLFSPKTSAGTGINQQMAFEGKIVLANGTNITDGTYNVEFKIYNGGTSSGGGTLQWTEDELVGGSGGVTMTNGTFAVNLGAVSSLSSVNWNSDTLWLSLQVGNSSSCTITTTFQSNCGGDGEMTPYIRLTSVPYAFNTLELGGQAAANYGTLAGTQTWSATNTFSGSLNANGGLGINGLETQSYGSALSASATSETVTNSNASSTASTVNGLNLALVGATNSNSNANTINGVNFANVTALANNTFNGLSFGTGYTDLITSANFKVDASGNIVTSGTYNGNTLTSSNLTFSAVGANTVNGSSGQNLTVQSQGSGQLILNSANGTLGLSSTTATVQRTAVGSTTLDLNDTANTTLILKNSGSGVANLNLYGGSLQTGSTPTTRLDNSGNLVNIGNFTSTAGTTFATTGSTGFIFKPGTDNASAFQVQNAAGTTTLFAIGSSTSTLTVSGTSTTFATLALTNTHFESTQTTAPTIGTPASCGTSPTSAVTAGSTDSAGSFTITSGSLSTGVCTTILTFNNAYAIAPKAIILSGATAAAAAKTGAVTATGTTTFTVSLGSASATSTAYKFYYWVIE